MKNKKSLLILILIIAAIGLGVFFILQKEHIVFTLNGESLIEINYGEVFNDPGFIATGGDGNSIANYVSTYGNVNNTIPGDYKIVYELNYKKEVQKLERIVRVKELSINDLEISLNGNEEVYLLKDDNYKEEGATIYYKYNHSIYSERDYTVNSNVNNNVVGNYNVVYSFVYNGQTINVTRNVKVVDITYTITPKEMTTSKVTIELYLEGIDNYSFTKLPNNYTELGKNIKYDVDKNGEYTFTIVLSNKEQFKKTVIINNIMDKLVCSGTINTSGTNISVTPISSDVKEYEWVVDGKTIKGGNTYSVNKVVNSAKVNLIFKNNQTYQMNCILNDKLVYHFKYDENNTKPFMRCNTYTAQDKIKYDAMLKQLVTEAGYGTRAGVVAAARFLVGGLDYKVPYLGPKTVNRALGRYQKIGLNIGQSGAWGCSVSGWTQGMDCTNFVSWAFFQNGITSFPYNTNHSSVRDNISKVKVGDLLYTPCVSRECKNDYKINHVGIIIGIDDKYIYVAESTTGTINAIIVSKLDKNNMPASGKFSRVHFFNYAKYSGEGNVTNMWM